MIKEAERVAGAGKGEMVRQELTSGWVTSRLGKPHPEQDQIGGYKDARSSPRVGRLTPMATSGLDRWSPPRQCRGTELGLQVYLTRFFHISPSGPIQTF